MNLRKVLEIDKVFKCSITIEIWVVLAIKKREIKQMKPEELTKRLSELKLELAKEYGNVKMGRATKNPGKIRALRKSIARMLTMKQERERTSG